MNCKNCASIKNNKPKGSLNARFITARNNLILSLLIFGGIRTCEVIILNMNDIKARGNFYMISILGKCNKYRTIAIEKSKIEKELELYLALRSKIVPPHLNKSLFISKQGKFITNHTIYNAVKTALKNNNLLGT